MPGASKYTAPGTPSIDLRDAADERPRDAEALLANGRWPSAIAMGVYSLEIHLKVGICRKLDLHELPRPFEIHDLESLLVLRGLRSALLAAPGGVRRNWGAVVAAAPELNDLRYRSPLNWGQADAHTFFQQLRDPPDGFLPWLSSQP